MSFSEKQQLIELGDKTQSREFFNVSMAKKFMQTFLVAGACKELIESGKTTSIRDLFYMTKHTIKGHKENTFDDQDESDPIIEDLEVGLDALREELHLFAAKQGQHGRARWSSSTPATRSICARMGSGGWSVPSIAEDNVIEFKKHEAKYVLLVEKEAVWHRLNEDKFWKKHKCILVTGGGQATRGVRRLLQRMATELKLPVYVLVDNDPWGLYIYSVVKQGSINLAYESMRMAVPKARFLGLRTLDFKKFKLSDDVKIELDERRHHARQADARLPVVRGEAVARRDQRSARGRLQDGDRSALQQGHQLRHRRLHSREDRQARLAGVSVLGTEGLQGCRPLRSGTPGIGAGLTGWSRRLSAAEEVT